MLPLAPGPAAAEDVVTQVPVDVPVCLCFPPGNFPSVRHRVQHRVTGTWEVLLLSDGITLGWHKGRISVLH